MHPSQLPRRVGDKTLPAHKVDLSQGKIAEPVLQVQDVQADTNGVPGRVHDAQALVSEGQLLEAGQVGGLGQSLGVVGYCTSDGVTHHHDELGVPRHGGDPVWRLFSHEVARRLLHRDLAFKSPWHQTSE